MVPRAKKNLHECVYHINKMVSSTHAEELAINFAAFVNSARNVTFVLQKEFAHDARFNQWYGDKDAPAIGTKRHEMKSDGLCTFFRDLRDQIVKEGTNGFICSTHIHQMNTGTDMLDQPANSSIEISSDGMYYGVHAGTALEDRIPARTKGRLTTSVAIQNPPVSHLGKPIPENERDILSLSKKYYEYLKSVVEEWTGMINTKK